jgi:hypothetical protein
MGVHTSFGEYVIKGGYRALEIDEWGKLRRSRK